VRHALGYKKKEAQLLGRASLIMNEQVNYVQALLYSSLFHAKTRSTEACQSRAKQ
jgi:hypothetical protein